jgi:predicted SnoaL-like aldol condensation-catalyzing enzyme
MSISPAADEHDSRSRGAKAMTRTEERNEALVLQAFDTLFNRRDYVAAQQFWSPTYIQHSAHIEPGREGLFNLVKASPADMRYENALTVANGDYVMLHSRFSNTGLPANWIVVDVVRLQTACLPNTGMSCKTRSPPSNPRAGCRCSAAPSRNKPDTAQYLCSTTISTQRQRCRRNGRA